MSFKAKPSARIKRIYFLIESKSRDEIEKVILDYVGILGWAKASPIFVEGGRKEGRMILSIDRKAMNDTRAAFEASPLRIKIIKSSGTISGLSR